MAMDNPLKEDEATEVNASAAYMLATSLMEQMVKKDILDKCDIADILEKCDALIPDTSLFPTTTTKELTEIFLDLREKFEVDH